MSVRRISMPARSPAPASGGPRRMARTSVLPEAKPWIGADSFRPNRMKIGAPRPAGRGGGNFADAIAKPLGKKTPEWLRAPDTECPALFHACAFSCARLRRAAPHGAYKRFAGGKALDWGGFIPPQSNENRGGTSLRRSPSSWASKPQIGFERRTLSVRRFSVTAGSVWCRGIVLDAGDVLY